MNAERLHVVAEAISNDIQNTETVETLSKIRDSLQGQVSQPNQPQHQQNLSAHLQTLRAAMESSTYAEFPPTWLQIGEELEADGFLGGNIMEKIEEIFTKNQITPSVALDDVNDLLEEVKKLSDSLESLLESFEYLKIGAEELEKGEVELGILVPRPAVNNQLLEFGNELVQLNKILAPFSELANGSRPGFTIKTISSSDLSVFLDVMPQVGACLAIAVERIVSLYKQILEIRKLRSELKEIGVPGESLTGVEDHVNSQMKTGIDELTKELVEKFGGELDGGRKNELSKELTVALSKIANRVDKGFNIEVRAEPDQDEDDVDGKIENSSPQGDAILTIQAAAKGMRFLKPYGDPILGLPEGNNDQPAPEKG